MLRHLPKYLPGLLFAALVLLFAGTNSLQLYPFGNASYTRPLLGAIGIFGAFSLLFGIPWWRICLPLWCFLQSFVTANDTSGEWFYQGLTLIFSRESHTAKSNNMIVDYGTSAFNFAGLLLLALLIIIAIFRLHPPIRFPFFPRFRRPKFIAFLAVPLLLLIAWPLLGAWQQSNATFVLKLDMPNVPIYYQDQLLGHTPLCITPEKIAAWKLPLDPNHELKLFAFGWADSVILSDGTSNLPLYAGVPWGFADKVDPFDSPWGTRARMHVGGEHENIRSGYLYPAPALRNEPILTITFRDPIPLAAASPLRIHCDLTNPTPKNYEGRKADIERFCFSYTTRSNTPTPGFEKIHRLITMPDTWNTLPTGAHQSADLEFDGPPTPGDYEFFCTWFLYDPAPYSNTGRGCVYSNMLRLQIK